MHRTTIVHTAVLAALAAPLVLIATVELSSQRYSGTRVPTKADMLVGGTQELQLTKLSGGWKYKEEEVDESQQNCVIGGKVPTSYTSFRDVGQIQIRTDGRYDYTPDFGREFEGFDHTFSTDEGKVNGPGTSFSSKFVSEPRAKSGKPPKPVKYGQFKAKIKNGEMSFQYAIPNGNASGLMVETGLYQNIQNNRTQDWFREVTHEKFEEGNAQVVLGLGDEVFYGEQRCGVKVGMSGGKAKNAK